MHKRLPIFMCVLQLIIAPVPTIEACKKRSAEIQKFEN